MFGRDHYEAMARDPLNDRAPVRLHDNGDREFNQRRRAEEEEIRRARAVAEADLAAAHARVLLMPLPLRAAIWLLVGTP